MKHDMPKVAQFEPRAGQGGLAPWQLRRAMEMMTTCPAGSSAAMLAAACGVSAGHFTRAFRISTGTTPHRWLMARRVERAAAMLLGTDLSVGAIALACGFSDQSHFTRAFATTMGTTPGAWRQAQQK